MATGQFLKAFYKRQEEERIFRTQKKELVKLTQELDPEIILHSNPSKKRLKGREQPLVPLYTCAMAEHIWFAAHRLSFLQTFGGGDWKLGYTQRRLEASILVCHSK